MIVSLRVLLKNRNTSMINTYRFLILVFVTLVINATTQSQVVFSGEEEQLLSFEKFSLFPSKVILIDDMNGDGLDDIIANGVSIFYQSPDGTFDNMQYFMEDTDHLTIGDFNRDQRNDIAYVKNGKIYIHLNEPDGIRSDRFLVFDEGINTTAILKAVNLYDDVKSELVVFQEAVLDDPTWLILNIDQNNNWKIKKNTLEFFGWDDAFDFEYYDYDQDGDQDVLFLRDRFISLFENQSGYLELTDDFPIEYAYEHMEVAVSSDQNIINLVLNDDKKISWFQYDSDTLVLKKNLASFRFNVISQVGFHDTQSKDKFSSDIFFISNGLTSPIDLCWIPFDQDMLNYKPYSIYTQNTLFPSGYSWVDFNKNDIPELILQDQYKIISLGENSADDKDRTTSSTLYAPNFYGGTRIPYNLNNDEWTDVIEYNFSSDKLTVLTNKSGKGFVPTQYPFTKHLKLSGANIINDIDTIDLNCDGWTDLLLGTNMGNFWIKNDNGQLLFAPENISLPNSNNYLTDINFDGKTDLIKLSEDDSLILYINNGNLDFTPVTIDTERKYYLDDIITIDVDQDGLLDVVLTSNNPRAFWYKNEGNRFVFKDEFGSRQPGRIISTGDLFNDGATSILFQQTNKNIFAVTYNKNTDLLEPSNINFDQTIYYIYPPEDLNDNGNPEFPVKLNTNQGFVGYTRLNNNGFDRPVINHAGNTAYAENFMDVDNDGRLEILSENTWYSFTNNGKAKPNRYYLSNSAININRFYQNRKIIDINKDGLLDFVFYIDGRLQCMLFDETTQRFGTVINLSNQSSRVTSAEKFFSGDYNNDGLIDFIVQYDDRIKAYMATSQFDQYVQTFSMGDDFNFLLTSIDYNGDGILDLYFKRTSTSYGVMYGNNDGTFRDIRTAKNLYYDRNFPTLDWDRDGLEDVIAIDNAKWKILLNEKGKFTREVTISNVLVEENEIQVGDVNGDGHDDIIFPEKGGYSWTTYNNGNPPIIKPLPFDDLYPLYAVKDYDGDGWNDIVNWKGWMKNLDGNGNFSDFSSHPESYHINKIGTKEIIDINNDGFVDFISDKEITINPGKPTSSESSKTLVDQSIESLSFYKFIDIDNDHRPEVVYHSDRILYRSELQKTTYGNTPFEVQRKLIDYPFSQLRNINQFDHDQDGDLDMIVITTNKIDLLEYEEQLDSFVWVRNIYRTENRNQLTQSRTGITDFNNDGKDDVLIFDPFKSKILVYLNEVNNFELISFDIDFADGFRNGKFKDLDLDGDMDLLIYDSEPIPILLTIVENIDNQSFVKKQSQQDIIGNMNGLEFIDINKDKFDDIIYGYNNKFETRYAIYDSTTHSFINQQLYSNKNGFSRLNFFDLNEDGLKDILYRENFLTFVSLNDYPGNGFSAATSYPDLLINMTGQSEFVDFDNDGDLDCINVFQTQLNENILVYENLSDTKSFEVHCFIDINQNGKRDSTEKGLAGCQIELAPLMHLFYTDASGTAMVFTEKNDLTINVKPLDQWTSTMDSTFIFVAKDSLQTNKIYEFGFFPSLDTTHLDIHISSSVNGCDRNVPFWVDLTNTGTTTTSGYIRLKLDDKMTTQSFDPIAQTDNDGNLVWRFEQLLPNQKFPIRMRVRMPNVLSSGDLLKHMAKIQVMDSLNWQDTLHVFTHKTEDVIGCDYQENEKSVTPNRQSQNYTLPSEFITYTIRFQNTSMDTVSNIEIVDQLDENLNWSSFQPIGSSHSYTVDVDENGLAIFKFKNINLPDSSSSQRLSNGYIQFKIMPVGGLAKNTEINNFAAIYFDRNAAIITNTVINTITNEIPPPDLKPTVLSEIKAYPNPFTSQITFELEEPLLSNASNFLFQLMNSRGEILLTRYAVLPLTLDNVDLLPGIYYFQFFNQNGEIYRGSIVKQ